MVDVNKLKSKMILKGYTQKSLVAEMRARGIKISENTFSSKMKNPGKLYCDNVDVICDILELKDPAEKAEIFLV